MDDNKIVEIATGVMDKYDIYVVKGKAIAICDNALDLSLDEDVEEILRFADKLYVDKFLQPCYGEDTICVLCPMDNREYAVSMSYLSNAPQDVSEKVKAAMAEYIKSNNQIAQIASDVSGEYDIYAVRGKAIAIKDYAFDLSDSYDVSRILSLSDDLFDRDKFLPAIYGSDTMAVVIAIGNGEYTVSMTCISGFPDGIQKKLKAAMDEQEKMRLAAVERIKNENQIVQIATDVLDEYDVYVVNGKPIGIKHHVLNVDNPEHLNDIVSTAKELFCVPDLPAIYKEDTICIFAPYDKKYCRSMISISDMGGFPDDVVKKVKSAVDGYAQN